MSRYCYWTVADGDYSLMAQATIMSARAVGVSEDFHVWSDRCVRGAITHPSGKFEKWGCLFKLTFLRDAVQHLDYDYFVWIDTDTYFVRNPGDLRNLLNGSPFHIALECDLLRVGNQRKEWWDCPLGVLVALMRERGVKKDRIYNVNGGLFIIERNAVDKLFRLAMDFFTFCNSRGYCFVDEPLLAYAMHMFCKDVEKHTVDATAEIWASDWTGEFSNRLPNGDAWTLVDYLTNARSQVNPAIVHAMRSKPALIESGRALNG